MAWSISTYAGLRVNGPVLNCRLAMFELCRAVNERQDSIGMTKTLFYKADGSEASYISYSDLLGMRITGPSSKVGSNLERIQDSVKALVNTGYFVTSSGGDTAYTLSSLETAIGTNLVSTPKRIQEARFWQAQKDALDLLIYCKRSYGFTFTSPTIDRRHYGGIPTPAPTSANAAWSGAIGETPTTIALSGSNTGLQMQLSKSFLDPPGGTLGPDWYYVAQIEDNVQGLTVTLDLLGSLVNFYYTYTVREVVSDTHPAPQVGMPVIINSTSFTNTPSGNSYDTTFSSRQIGDNSDISLSGTYSMDYTIDLPGSAPWEPEPGTGQIVELDIGGITVYWDLPSVLTDQA